MSSSARDAGARGGVDPGTTIVVSGLPRSGTSLMMQMIVAAGVPAFVDEHRPADASNPRGYLEHAAIRRLDRDTRCLEAARGHVVKIVSPLLPRLPDPHSPFVYRVVFLRRDMEEVLRSQAAMLAATATATPAATAADRVEPGLPEAKLRSALEKADARARRFAATRPDVESIEVEHAALLVDPLEVARRVAAFVLGWPDEERAAAMASRVDPSLHRARRAKPGR